MVDIVWVKCGCVWICAWFPNPSNDLFLPSISPSFVLFYNQAEAFEKIHPREFFNKFLTAGVR